MTDRRTGHDQSVHLDPGILGTRGADPARASKDLSGDKERDQRRQTPSAERESSADQIILMGAERRIRLMVHVVSDQRNFLRQSEILYRALENHVSCAIARHH